MSSSGYSTQRSGKEALYSLTPFKIQNAEIGNNSESYSLILVPLAYMEIQLSNGKTTRSVTLNWYESFIEEFKVQIPLNKTVIQPSKLYTRVFRSDSPIKYIYKIKDDKESYNPYYPRYIEFSYNSLSKGYYCEIGKVLLSSDSKCPLAKKCKAKKLIDNKDPFSCIYYKGPKPYTALYTVFSHVISIYEEYSIVNKEVIVSHPLFTVYYVPSGQYTNFINGVYFIPKGNIDMLPKIVYLDQWIGYRIRNMPAIKFEFEYLKLKDLIRKILDNNDEIRRWIKLKYLLYVNNKKFNIYFSTKGYYTFKKLANILDSLLSVTKNKSGQSFLKNIDDSDIAENEIEFASFLFLHSLAHMLLTWILAKYGYRREGISYYIVHPLLGNTNDYENKVSIYIVEEAIGGLGYLKSFRDEVKKDLRNFRAFLSSALENLIECEFEVKNEIKKFFDLLQNPNFTTDPNLKKLINLIKAAYYSLYYDQVTSAVRGVYPHINSIRELIVTNRFVNQKIRASLDDILEASPHCWDGCPLCVMLERNCQFPIFDQPFLVSRELIRAVLEKIDIDILSQILSNYQDIKDQTIVSSKLKRGEGLRFFKALLRVVRETLDISSPWFSPQIVESILSIAKNNEKLHVRIITTNDTSQVSHKESLELFKEYIKKSKNVEVKIVKELHAKGMLVDGALLMDGSANFTLSGLTGKIESVRITKDQKEVKDFLETFNSLWEQSAPLE